MCGRAVVCNHGAAMRDGHHGHRPEVTIQLLFGLGLLGACCAVARGACASCVGSGLVILIMLIVPARRQR